jgi:hypothetical protein
MLDWSSRLTQCWESFDDLYDGRHDGRSRILDGRGHRGHGACHRGHRSRHTGHRARHTGQEAWLGGWDWRGHGGKGQTQDAEDGVGNHVGGGEVFGLVRVSEWEGIG